MLSSLLLSGVASPSSYSSHTCTCTPWSSSMVTDLPGPSLSVSQAHNELSCTIAPCHPFRHRGMYFIFQIILSVWSHVELSELLDPDCPRRMVIESVLRPTRAAKKEYITFQIIIQTWKADECKPNKTRIVN